MFVIALYNGEMKPTARYYAGTSSTTDFHASGLSTAKRYNSLGDAIKALESIRVELDAKPVDDLSFFYNAWFPTYFKIIAEDSIPYHDSWHTAFPIDTDHIHESGRPVRIVPRDGYAKKSEVSGDFLRNELLRGDTRLSNDGFSRWEYYDA